MLKLRFCCKKANISSYVETAGNILPVLVEMPVKTMSAAPSPHPVGSRATCEMKKSLL
jgi:hypothetical protein